ncbi:hypothetical protein O3M35_012826 [Rhynocoris fuscipes]|uniref:F-box domain-containing protein n=1 Tax=Rhynocoris fuscipes TaxID=488301 RepID=A0AAW1CFN2_9HEMI
MEKQNEEEKDSNFDLLLSLPKELGLKVLTYLSGQELSTVCKVSKNWRELANCNLLWKKLCSMESICDLNDSITEQIESENDGNDLEPQCRWSKIYVEKMRLYSNWAGDNYTWMSIDQEKQSTYKAINSSVDVYNNILAVAYWVDSVPTVDIFDIKSNCLQQLQTISLPFTIDRDSVGVCINGSLLVIELSNISVIYKYENGKFIYEILVVPDMKTICPTGEDQQFVQNYHNCVRCWTLCLAGRFIWYQATSAIIIYDRNTQTFRNMDDILQVVAVDIHGELIVVQCPHSVRVFYVDGKLLYTYSANTNMFYTGLVMSSTSFAFLQSEDFSDPHVVQVELRTWKIYRETQLRVYRVTLHKNAIFLLSQDPFSLTSMSHGDVKWRNSIRGTKYLRPGKDFFTVICSRYIFVCPSLARLDVFSLYDVNSGDHLYDTTLGASSYNIQTVSDSCLVVYSKKSAINIRSYV